MTVFSSNELQSFDFDELRVRAFGYAFTSPSLNISPLTSAEAVVVLPTPPFWLVTVMILVKEDPSSENKKLRKVLSYYTT